MTTPILDIPFKGEYSTVLEFKTNIVERFCGNEQRKPTQFHPLRTFTIPLNLTPERREKLEEFFIAMKGACNEFLWRWEEETGGSGETYRCYFADDKLEAAILHGGYSQSDVKICAIQTRNVVKNGLFLDLQNWETGLAYSVAPPKITLANTKSTVQYLSQKGILKSGETYRVVIEAEGVSGQILLSASTMNISASERLLVNGKKTIRASAAGSDFKIEFPANARCTIKSIVVNKEYKDPEELCVPYLNEHAHSIRFFTIKDLLHTSHGKRIAAFALPLRGWVLSFRKNARDMAALEDYFTACKGRFKAFEWTYPQELGGDGKKYRVRFDTDTFEAKRDHMGYGWVQLPIVEAR